MLQGHEDSIPLQTVCNQHSLLYIKALVLEGTALVHLTQVDLLKAQQPLADLLRLAGTHPKLVGTPLQATLHLLTGQSISTAILAPNFALGTCAGSHAPLTHGIKNFRLRPINSNCPFCHCCRFQEC